MRALAHELVRSQSQLDVLITPTLPSVPRPLGWYRSVASDFKVHTERLCRDVMFTAPFNLSGQPAISLPLHMAAPDLPVGIQFVGKIGDDATLLVLARQLEQAQPWRNRRSALLDR
jgi:Asp-tRNA(Asn)/Glu-tRNA(Gln) amidotransferase A subunit family amidase